MIKNFLKKKQGIVNEQKKISAIVMNLIILRENL